MAWIKAITREDTAAVAEYWDVMSVVYDHRSQTSVLRVGGWVSKVAYDADKQPLMIKEWTIPSGLAPELAAGAVAFVTDFAQRQAEFTGWSNVPA